MAEKPPPPPLTEPVIIPCLYVTGLAVEVTRHAVRLVGFVELPDLGGETHERRIAGRLAMTLEAALALRDDLSAVLGASRGHS